MLFYEFKRDLNTYLATRTGVPIHTLADAIAFNNAHASQELQYFGQEEFLLAESDPFTTQQYQDALAQGHRLAGAEGIDAALANNNVTALVAPSGGPAWTTDLINGDHFGGSSTYPSAVAGYPIVNVPMGFVDGVLPVGLSFIGTAWSEPTLIKYAYAYEQATKLRRAPTYLPTLPFPNGESAFSPSAGLHGGRPGAPGSPDGPAERQPALPHHPPQPVSRRTRPARPLAPAGRPEAQAGTTAPARASGASAGPRERTSWKAVPSSSARRPPVGKSAPSGPGSAPTARLRPSRFAR